MSVYVVDSNFFIQAHRATYPLDIAFSFWKKVKQLAEEGKIISIDKIKIPDACDAFDVQFVNTMDMFRQLSESF